MREILLNNGFTDNGSCSRCGGRAWLFTKVVNGKVAELKLFLDKFGKDMSKARLKYKGQNTFIDTAMGADLQIVLNTQGLAATVQS